MVGYQTKMNVKVYGTNGFKKGTADSAGWDLCCIDDVTIPPRSNLTIPISERFVFGASHLFGKIEARSSAARRGIIVRGGIIDSDYRGPISVMLTNTSDEEYSCPAGKTMY